jgi:hypothetical protein
VQGMPSGAKGRSARAEYEQRKQAEETPRDYRAIWKSGARHLNSLAAALAEVERLREELLRARGDAT